MPAPRVVSGVTLEILTGGAGPPLLILHDIEYLNQPQPFLEELARRFSVLAPSHPGFGTSALPEHFDSIEDLTYLYLDLAQDLGSPNVIGMGLGGWIAAEMAVRSTAHIRRLVLVDAVGIKVGGVTDRDIADTFIIGPEEFLKLAWHDPEAGKRVMKFPSAALPEAELTPLLRNRQGAALFGWNPFMHNPKLLRRLYRINVPALVLWGESDRIVTPAYGRVYAAAIPGARFETVPNAGHYPYLEQPRRFVEMVTQFLNH